LATKQTSFLAQAALDCFASLAMTKLDLFSSYRNVAAGEPMPPFRNSGKAFVRHRSFVSGVLLSQLCHQNFASTKLCIEAPLGGARIRIGG
jgi:hypothetical protein